MKSMTLEERLATGEVVMTATLPYAGEDQVQAAANREAIMRHMTRYGLGKDTFSAPLVSIDPNILGEAFVGRTAMPEDTTRQCGLFVTARAIAAAAQQGGDPILSRIFPQYAPQQPVNYTQHSANLFALTMPRIDALPTDQ